jgi:hypothetical protein
MRRIADQKTRPTWNRSARMPSIAHRLTTWHRGVEVRQPSACFMSATTWASSIARVSSVS